MDELITDKRVIIVGRSSHILECKDSYPEYDYERQADFISSFDTIMRVNYPIPNDTDGTDIFLGYDKLMNYEEDLGICTDIAYVNLGAFRYLFSEKLDIEVFRNNGGKHVVICDWHHINGAYAKIKPLYEFWILRLLDAGISVFRRDIKFAHAIRLAIHNQTEPIRAGTSAIYEVLSKRPKECVTIGFRFLNHPPLDTLQQGAEWEWVQRQNVVISDYAKNLPDTRKG